MDVQETELEGVDWINLAEDDDNYWAVVNLALNIVVPKLRGISCS
jgi:hypothetical protein